MNYVCYDKYLKKIIFASILLRRNEKIERILKLGGIDINLKIELGLTPLILTLVSGNWKAIDILLKHGVDINEGIHISTFDSHLSITPLDIAIYYGLNRSKQILMERGAKVKKENDYQIVMKSITNSYELSVFNRWEKTIPCMQINLLWHSLLQKNETRINNIDGVMSIHQAVLCEDYQSLKSLIKEGIDVNTKDSLGRPVIQTIFTNGDDSMKIMNLLLSWDATCNVSEMLNKSLDLIGYINGDLEQMRNSLKSYENIVESLLFRGFHCDETFLRGQWIQEPNLLCEDNVKILTKCLIKKQIAGMSLNERDLRMIESADMEDFKKKCTDEIEKMNKCCLYDNITYYNFLRASRRMLVKHSRSTEVCAIFDEDSELSRNKNHYKLNFPIYHNTLEFNYFHGQRYKLVFDEALDQCAILLKIAFSLRKLNAPPLEVTEKIFNYLNYSDMVNLINM